MEAPRLFWRHRLWIASCLLVGLAAGEAATRLLPPTFQASTLIMVESQKVPADYIKATVTSNMEERLRTIEQQVTKREALARIVEELDLYPDLGAGAPVEEIVRRARRDLSVEVLGGRVFRVYFRGRSPEKAAAAANRIAELFIAENLELRKQIASTTTEFLERELEATEGRLEEQERTVADFRRLHEGSLPDQRDSNTSALTQLQIRLGLVSAELDKQEIRRLYLERGRAGEGVPIQRRLEALRTELDELRSRYTSKHPEVVSLQQAIARLEEEAARPRPQGAAPRPDTAESLDELEREAVDQEIARLRGERDRILDEIALLQRRVEAIPRVEQELLGLTRDYENLQQSYQSLLRKQIEAQLAENLEIKRQSEQFTILERAIRPTLPTAPKRWLLLLLGLAAGGLLGPGLVLFRHQTRQTFDSAEDLQRAFPGVKVLGAIPRLGSPPRRGLRRWLDSKGRRRAA